MIRVRITLELPMLIVFFSKLSFTGCLFFFISISLIMRANEPGLFSHLGCIVTELAELIGKFTDNQ